MPKQQLRERQGAQFIRWLRPLLDCLRELGAARPREVVDWIAEKEKLSEDARELLESKQERFYNQVHWARQYLVWEGPLDDSKRGIWSLTPQGVQTRLTDEQARKVVSKWIKVYAEARRKTESGLRSKKATLVPVVDVEPPPEDEVTNKNFCWFYAACHQPVLSGSADTCY